MKKLMSKKANIFGKKIPVFVIALIAVIGLAAAALVPYLSGLITGNVVVDSPFTLTITGGNVGYVGNTFTIPASEAFNEHWLTFSLHNGASTPINTIVMVNTSVSDPNNHWATPIGQEFVVYLVGREIVAGSFNEAACTANEGIVGTGSDSGYCWWDAANSVIPGTHGIVNNQFIYLFGGQSGSPGTSVPASTTINGKVKLAFAINAMPDTYTFTAQAMMPNEVPTLSP